jgi:hypothetical protein
MMAENLIEWRLAISNRQSFDKAIQDFMPVGRCIVRRSSVVPSIGDLIETSQRIDDGKSDRLFEMKMRVFARDFYIHNGLMHWDEIETKVEDTIVVHAKIESAEVLLTWRSKKLKPKD